MTVSELIAELRKFEGNTPVLVSGYESGDCFFKEINKESPRMIAVCPSDEWAEGVCGEWSAHGECNRREGDARCKIKSVVVIER